MKLLGKSYVCVYIYILVGYEERFEFSIYVYEIEIKSSWRASVFFWRKRNDMNKSNRLRIFLSERKGMFKDSLFRMFILNISSIVKKILISMHRKYVVSNVLGIKIMILVRKFESWLLTIPWLNKSKEMGRNIKRRNWMIILSSKIILYFFHR